MENKSRNRRFRVFGRSMSSLTILLVVSLSVTLVFATSYAVLNWTMNATVVANPKVCFMLWASGAKANTFTYSVNIFPGVTTTDANITYAVENWDSGAHNVYFQLASTNTNTTDVTTVNCTVYNGGQLWTEQLAGGATDSSYSTACSAAAGNYTIEIVIVCAGTAVAGHVPSFTWNMKVDNP